MHVNTILKSLRRMHADARGVAAIEFAMTLPILVTIYFGLAELTRVIDTSRKLTLYARTLADLSGRADNATTTDEEMTVITAATRAILWPLDVSRVQIIVDAMGVKSVDDTLYGGVCSSWAQNATKRPAQQLNGTNDLPMTPATYNYDGARYILAEVKMPYRPILGSSLYKLIFGQKGLVLSRQISWAQRTSAEIVMPGGLPCPHSN